MEYPSPANDNQKDQRIKRFLGWGAIVAVMVGVGTGALFDMNGRDYFSGFIGGAAPTGLVVLVSALLLYSLTRRH